MMDGEFLAIWEHRRILSRMDRPGKGVPGLRRSVIGAREMFWKTDPFADPEPLIHRVYAYCAYRLGHGADAEDAAADTFERALRHRRSYDPRKGTPMAWLIGIARRCIDDVVSARLPTVETLPALPAPDDDADLRLDIGHTLARLDPHDRELLALRYGADLTAKQIGEVLEMGTHAVEMALHRALARLRQQVERERPAAPLPGVQTGTAR
jgi:RNA polymerase sigma-70 factor (ECF subfamily)